MDIEHHFFAYVSRHKIISKWCYSTLNDIKSDFGLSIHQKKNICICELILEVSSYPLGAYSLLRYMSVTFPTYKQWFDSAEPRLRACWINLVTGRWISAHSREKKGRVSYTLQRIGNPCSEKTLEIHTYSLVHLSFRSRKSNISRHGRFNLTFSLVCITITL